LKVIDVQAAAINRFLLEDAGGLRRDLARRTIKEVIADKLAALIASGVLGVGDVLPSERELAGALSVSRETVRAAVQVLSARGILEVAQGTRTRVVSVDVGDMTLGGAGRLNVNAYDLDAVHAARMLIERQVVADATGRVSAETLERLGAALEAQERCLNDPVRFLISDREFHAMIYRECGNPLLADIATDLYTYLLEYRRRVVSQPGSIANSLADHRAILAALVAGDAPVAVAAFGVHEKRIYTSTRALLAQAGGGTRRD
jgi:DNA-binding FadR family transcriptional regulator